MRKKPKKVEEVHIILYTKRKTGTIIPERFDADSLMDPEDMLRRRPRYERRSVTTQAEAEDYCKELLAKFNATLSPGESPRDFVRCELVNPSKTDEGGGK